MFVRLLLVTFLITLLAWSVLARGSEGAGAGEPYRVRAGDTLWSIAAEHYRGDPREGVWRLQRENGLGGAVLQPGQVIVIP
ncbi:MAG TPA: LysM peptidoglycan-binding domain-containing protein [Gaiellaceae bacterium]|jgi:LysM repeat protein|nr:LysM peptidoglycan-binding domain-containing protein [Gaiellaceae bacterium]